MKKVLTLLVVCVGILQVSAQSETSATFDGRMNDIMLSPIELIAAPALNVSYERLLSETSGIGINGLFYLGNDDDTYRFSQISPYYRMYFGKKYASGFFVEGFIPITMIKDDHYVYTGDYSAPTWQEKSDTSVGIGIGFGGKWVARKNIVFEASAGIGRRFTSNDTEYDNGVITGKGMLGIGYRF